MLPTPVIFGILKFVGLIVVIAGITIIAIRKDKITIKIKKGSFSCFFQAAGKPKD